jgi:nucleoside-diphosphate-sugar epimerase/carbamoylphosphate synthase large subunit
MIENKRKKHNIAISCIGSGVGQSIINSLNICRLPIKTIGLGTNPFAYGAYDCNYYEYTPSIYNESFIEELIKTYKKNNIDLLIPSLDDEVLIYSKNSDRFKENGINAIYAKDKMVSLCRDKEKMSFEINKIIDVFVKSYNKKTLVHEIDNKNIKFPLIAKPRGGFASQGVEIIRNEEDLSFLNEGHIIQELAIPKKSDPNYNFYINQIKKRINPQVSEISIQLVFDKSGIVIGKMSSYNKLKNGVPIEIIPFENDYIWSVIDKLIPIFQNLGIVGPLNIQGRLTEDGLKLFEMNPRFTGITGLRAIMGFNEVEACVKEWLSIDKGNNQLVFNYKRFGIRQTADKSIPIERNKEVFDLFKNLNRGEKKTKKIVFITGSCGYLGQNLINKLIKDNSFEIWLFDLDKNRIEDLFNGKVQKIIDYEDLQNGIINIGNVDILLHLGFTRPHGSNQQIANSLKFTNELFTRAFSNHLPAIINISSQSVYGLETNPPWTEKTPVAPKDNYSQAKYATELFLEIGKKNLNTLHYSSLRLCTLAGGAKGLVEVDFLSKIARTAIDGDTIHIVGGMQQMERLDIRDAVDAIIAMLKTNSAKWKHVYNLGSGQVFSLKEITEKTINISSKYNGGKKSKINIEQKDINIKFGMDSTQFYKDMHWKPRYTIYDIIESLMIYYKKN